jgi:hypothetical protein
MAMEVEKTVQPDVLLVAQGPTAAAAALAQGASAVARIGGGGGGAVFMERRLVTLILINLASIMERADEALLPAVYDQVCNLWFVRSCVCVCVCVCVSIVCNSDAFNFFFFVSLQRVLNSLEVGDLLLAEGLCCEVETGRSLLRLLLLLLHHHHHDAGFFLVKTIVCVVSACFCCEGGISCCL